MVAGYDRFFSTFDGFGPVWAPNVGKAIGIARKQAADDHIAYLELMTLPQAGAGFYAGVASLGDADFATLAAGIAPLLPAAIAKARADFDRFEAEALAANDCAGTAPAAACRVTVRYQVAALRNLPPAQVFAQLSFGFALAEADPRFVGVNIVAPEHDPLSIRDYDLHMRMLAFLKARHPAVALSLHAGELTLGLVPPPDLSDHISKAVAAGARRIGHGVDIAYERDAAALLKRMARDRIAVEINLTSNAVILGVKGKDHPLSLYRAFGVPIVLATDDQGVSRSDMTNEYLRAVTEQHLRYHDLKQAARDALEYAFLPGASLWRNGTGGAKVLACAGPAAAPACQAFLGKNLKAKLQWQLEQDFSAFERTQPPQRP
jgi:adenosine deaminase